ncbi:MAG: hypothetical protein ACK5R0_15330 [Bacteroidota bacterium]
MMRIFFTLFFFLSILFGCDTPGALEPNETDYFLKYYGLDGEQTGVDFVVNPDGTFVLLGNSLSSKQDGKWQYFVVKVDAKGKTIWEKTFGGPLNEEAKDIELLKDGNLIIAGNSEKTAGERDVFLLRLRQDGTPIDNVRQGLRNGATELDENVSSVTEVSAGLVNPAGFIVTGSTTGGTNKSTDLSDAMHMRFTDQLVWISDASGNWKSRPTFGVVGFEGTESATKVVQFNSNTYYVFGTSNVKNAGPGNPVGSLDFWFYSLSDQANQPVDSRYFGDDSYDEQLYSVTPSRGTTGYILTGTRQNLNSADKEVDVFNVLLSTPISFSSPTVFRDPAGVQNLGNIAVKAAYLGVGQTNYWVTTNKADGATVSVSLSQLDAAAKKTFDRTFGGAGTDTAGPIAELPDGKVVTIGTMTLGGSTITGQRKMFFMKLNSNGQLAR